MAQISVTVNGVEKAIEEGCTLATLIHQMGLDTVTVVALINESIVEKEKFPITQVSSGDVVELVAFVRGG